MRAIAAALPLSGMLVIVFAPRTASAWERGQGLGLDAGMAMLTINNENPETGVAFGLHYSLRLTDQFDLVGELGGAITDLDPIVTPTSPTDRPQMVWNATAGVIYKLDIVRFVPYFGALVGPFLMNGGSLPSPLVLPGAEVAVGGDYFLTRQWAVGLAIRETFFVTDMSTYPSYLTVTGRIEFTWGGLD
jgi:hypothetical protein